MLDDSLKGSMHKWTTGSHDLPLEGLIHQLRILARHSSQPESHGPGPMQLAGLLAGGHRVEVIMS